MCRLTWGDVEMIQWKDPEILVLTHGITCEGPLWDSILKRLYYVDITGKRLHIHDWYSGNNKAVQLQKKVCFVVLGTRGELFLGLEDAIYRYNQDGSIVKDSKQFEIAGDRLNDGKAGPDGRIYTGTIRRDGGAKLYRYHEHTFIEILDDVRLSNGMEWSIDEKTFFYCDTLTHRIDAFDYDYKTGTISNRRTVIEIPTEQGSPDGLTIDMEGNLWVALWGGGKVIKVNPKSGCVIGEIILPVTRVSSCSFAGENMEYLVITTASGNDISNKELLAGCVFKIHVNTYGRASFRYKSS